MTNVLHTSDEILAEVERVELGSRKTHRENMVYVWSIAKCANYTKQMARGGRGSPGRYPRSFCLFMFVHVITPFGWRHVYVALVHG